MASDNNKKKQKHDSFFMNMLIDIMGKSLNAAVKEVLKNQSYMNDRNTRLGLSGSDYLSQHAEMITEIYLNKAYNQMIEDTQSRIYEEAKKATDQAVQDALKEISSSLKSL